MEDIGMTGKTTMMVCINFQRNEEKKFGIFGIFKDLCISLRRFKRKR